MVRCGTGEHCCPTAKLVRLHTHSSCGCGKWPLSGSDGTCTGATHWRLCQSSLAHLNEHFRSLCSWTVFRKPEGCGSCTLSLSWDLWGLSGFLSIWRILHLLGVGVRVCRRAVGRRCSLFCCWLCLYFIVLCVIWSAGVCTPHTHGCTRMCSHTCCGGPPCPKPGDWFSHSPALHSRLLLPKIGSRGGQPPLVPTGHVQRASSQSASAHKSIH
jgi:hypothetical protein